MCKLGREAERRHRERQRWKIHRETGIGRRKTRKEGRDWQVRVKRRSLSKTETDRYMVRDLHSRPTVPMGWHFCHFLFQGEDDRKAAGADLPATFLLPFFLLSFSATAFGLAWGQGGVGSVDSTELSVMRSGLKMGLFAK